MNSIKERRQSRKSCRRNVKKRDGRHGIIHWRLAAENSLYNQYGNCCQGWEWERTEERVQIMSYAADRESIMLGMAEERKRVVVGDPPTKRND